MESKYLSEVIDFKRDIEPYQIIQIYSGVGSGKNHWVETLAVQGYNILLITSRKATADVQAAKLGGKRWIDLDKLCSEGFEKRKQKIVAVTNAGIERFFKRKYSSSDEKTHIWNYFDFIILDEAHSLVADATFSDSPFYVKRFLKYVQKNCEKCKIIFMTGTPEPIDWLFSEKLKKSPTYKYLCMYDCCRHVEPKEVYLFPSHKIEYDIFDCFQNGDRIIYFANSISRMEKMVTLLCEMGMPQESIGIGYSQQENRNFPESILRRKNEIRKYLVEQEMIPEEIKLFLTTSQNKEGINILNDDIKIMISESCDRAALVQMAGRVRKGVDVLVILYDAKQHFQRQTEIDTELDRFCCNSVKTFWHTYDFNRNNIDVIDAIEEKFPAIRYDYLKDDFAYYFEREKSIIQISEDQAYLRNCYETWNLPPNLISDYYLEKGQGQLDLEKWFPYSEVSRFRRLSIDEQRKKLDLKLHQFIESSKYFDREITKEEQAEFIESLNSALLLWGYDYREMDLKIPIKQANPFLNKFGYQLKATSHKAGTNYRLGKVRK